MTISYTASSHAIEFPDSKFWYWDEEEKTRFKWFIKCGIEVQYRLSTTSEWKTDAGPDPDYWDRCYYRIKPDV